MLFVNNKNKKYDSYIQPSCIKGVKLVYLTDFSAFLNYNVITEYHAEEQIMAADLLQIMANYSVERRG